jgi:hypothetical protein
MIPQLIYCLTRIYEKKKKNFFLVLFDVGDLSKVSFIAHLQIHSY